MLLPEPAPHPWSHFQSDSSLHPFQNPPKNFVIIHLQLSRRKTWGEDKFSLIVFAL
jgi:hypothetical protein